MQATRTFAVFVIMCVIFNLGCASVNVGYDDMQLEQTIVDKLAEHREKLHHETSAQLIQVTIRSKKLTKRFNLEMYHRNDTTAFYTGGFIGKGSFKGLLTGSMLQFAMLREKQYFDGLVTGLIEPDFSQYEYVLMRLMEILSGNLLCHASSAVPCDICNMWDQELFIKGDRIKKVIFRSLIDPIAIEVNLFKFKKEFPFYQIKQVKICNNSNGSKIKLKFIEQHYGPVPKAKFRMPDFAGWERIDYFELK